MTLAEKVKALQTGLRARDLYRLTIDGDFGNGSADAVAAALDLVDRLEPLRPATTVPPLTPASDPMPSDIADIISRRPQASRTINEIIVHCTATPQGRGVAVHEIRGWHLGRGWRDIGYHWIVLLDGSLHPGRPEEQIGSHVAGHNEGTLGIVYVGGCESDGRTPKDTRTPAQKAALLAAVKALITKYPTVKKVSGHNQYAAKACPSFDVRKDPLGRLL
jgi:N-acetylmuramoyl-L-alanine amidase